MLKNLNKHQVLLLGHIIVLALAMVAYRLLVGGKLEQTAALFIGVPALISIGLTLLPPAKTVTGLLVKGSLIALSLSGIVLGEGFVCVLMATPIFLLIAVIVGWAISRSKSKNKTRLLSIAALLPMAMEGVLPDWEFRRHDSVSYEQVVDMNSEDIADRLNQQISFSNPLPEFLRLGFPMAQQVRGEGLLVGDTRCIHFSGGEGQPGDLCLKVAEKTPNKVRFQMTKNNSHIAHWLRWKDSIVQWEPLPNGKTRVRWTVSYDRELDPAWYFAPLEKYGVGLATEYLLQSYFGENTDEL